MKMKSHSFDGNEDRTSSNKGAVRQAVKGKKIKTELGNSSDLKFATLSSLIN